MKIYVSSTKADLADYRAAVLAVIQDLGHGYVAMEEYSADNRPPVEKCLQDVVGCSLYVGLFAWRYGYVPPDQQFSITELEYRQAVERCIPTLIFLLDEKVPWLPEYVDEGKRGERHIDRLRAELKKEKTVSFFNGTTELRAKASKAIKEAVDITITKPRVSLRLPQAGAAQFGREQEMRRLDAAWKDGRTFLTPSVSSNEFAVRQTERRLDWAVQIPATFETQASSSTLVPRDMRCHLPLPAERREGSLHLVARRLRQQFLV